MNEIGRYKAIIQSQGWSQSSTGNWYFWCLCVANEALDGQNLDPTDEFRLDFYFTEKAASRSKRGLRALGAKQNFDRGVEVSMFHPDDPNHTSFVGKEVEVEAKHKENSIYLDYSLIIPKGSASADCIPLDEAKGIVLGQPMNQFHHASRNGRRPF